MSKAGAGELCGHLEEARRAEGLGASSHTTQCLTVI